MHACGESGSSDRLPSVNSSRETTLCVLAPLSGVYSIYEPNNSDDQSTSFEELDDALDDALDDDLDPGDIAIIEAASIAVKHVLGLSEGAAPRTEVLDAFSDAIGGPLDDLRSLLEDRCYRPE